MTTCTQPNRFDEWEFEALLDGASSPEFAQHVQQCAHCAKSVSYLRAEAEQLAATLARADCPPAETLQAYRWGQLAPSQTQAIVAHLQECRACTTELAQLLGPLRAAQPHAQPAAPSLTEAIRQRLRILAATLLPADPSAIPALRGNLNSATLSYAVAEGAWELVLHLLPESIGYAVSGQLLGPDDDALQDAHVTLLRSDAFVAEANLDASGWFEMRVAEPGLYVAVVDMPDNRIVADVQIGVGLP